MIHRTFRRHFRPIPATAASSAMTVANYLRSEVSNLPDP